MAELGPAVDVVIARCLSVSAGEDVLVIVDPPTRRIGEALRDAAAGVGADAVLAVMDERENDGTEPPPTLAAALSASDVFIAPTSRSLSHTAARKRASDTGARGATMPGVTEEMLARVMAVDFSAMAARSRAVAGMLTGGSVARITCPRGTDATIELGGRSGIADDGDLSAAGAFGNLPCGEGFISPGGGSGKVVPASLAPLGITPDRATLTIEDGRLVAADGGLASEFMSRLTAQGEDGSDLAELGVGTNDRATLTGNVLEDEKILGSVHVAFGASAGIGGTVSVPIHLDVVVLDATLDIDDRRVLDAGRFVLGDA